MSGAPREGLLKPHYLFRPGQAVRRALHALRGAPPHSATVVLPWKLHLRVDTAESLGAAVWRLGLYDLAVSEALWRLTSPGDLALDIGANLGHMTGILALRAGPRGRVVAFEPSPRVFPELEANAALATADPRTAPIELHRVAVGGKVGTGYLDLGDPRGDNQGLARLVERRDEGVEVSLTTLDAVLGGRRAAVVKVDVEGAAGEVFAGARESLRDGRIGCLVYEAHADEREPLAALLGAAGYSVLGLGRDLFGLVLSPNGEAPRLPPYEAPSYLAVRDPGPALAALRPRGWRVLSPAAGRQGRR